LVRRAVVAQDPQFSAEGPAMHPYSSDPALRIRSLLPIDRNTYPQPENRSQGARDSSAARAWTMFPKLSTDSTGATGSVTAMFMLYFNSINITSLIAECYRMSAEPESRKATVSSLSPFRVVT